jgi:hypothetical protein
MPSGLGLIFTVSVLMRRILARAEGPASLAPLLLTTLSLVRSPQNGEIYLIDGA